VDSDAPDRSGCDQVQVIAAGRITAEPYMQDPGTVALAGELSGHVFPNLTLM
jgi:hypothetical protein